MQPGITETESEAEELPKLSEEDAPKTRKRLPKFGIGVSVAWLAFIAIYSTLNWSGVRGLEPNELGDFLAGVFAPLAFLWLVLGFFQQGEELRNSGKALWLQGEELRNSVEQQRDLVNVTREQLKFDSEMLMSQRDEIARNSQPILTLSQRGSTSSGDHKRLYTFSLHNHGKTCTGVKISSGTNRRVIPVDGIPTGERFEFRLELPVSDAEPFVVKVDYIDERLQHGSKSFKVIQKSPSGFDIEDLP